MRNEATSFMPIVFVPHGGGPLPLMNDAEHLPLIEFMRELHRFIPAPRAILIISAHWEEPNARVSAAAAPAMIFDYSGFPTAAYEYTYPAPGAPALASEVVDLLNAAGLNSELDLQRGFDHGTFVPLMLMYPDAKVPVVQLSLVNSLEAGVQIALGKAIAPLREQGVLIVGSGMSFHNMRAFFGGEANVAARSKQFDNWLSHCLTEPALTNKEREHLLLHWKAAPESQFSHPREEHLLPLMVCFGAASPRETPAQKIFSGRLFKAEISGFMW